MIDAVLNPLLAAQGAITALVDTRIYPMELPQEATLPAITYKVVGMRTAPTFQTAGMFRYRVQCDCWAMTYAVASALRSALVGSLNGFTGTVNEVVVQNMNVLQPIDFFEHEALQYRLSVEFYIVCNT